MRNNMGRTTATGLVLWVLALAGWQTALGQNTGTEDTSPTAAETGTETPADTPPTSERAEEQAIEAATTARPTLDYEPTESISEDSSVSFPVDI